ncbi:MAG: redoxin family protein [Clostridia bacterium]|nr:redoxin family protein [Clostridia bacterium]
MKKIIALIMAAMLAFSSFAFVSAEKADATREAVGMSIVGFNTQDLYGNPVTSDILNNAVCTVINEWATWCGPCVSEMPHFQAMHEYYSSTPEADVQIIGAVYISGSCTVTSARQFLENNGYTWLNVREDQVLENAFFTVDSIPSTIIVDRNGLVRDHRVGSFTSSAQLQAFIDGWYQTLLEEEGGSETVPGDINDSGSVELGDAVLALRMALGISEASNVEAGDMNGNGSIDVSDAIIILRMAMGL